MSRLLASAKLLGGLCCMALIGPALVGNAWAPEATTATGVPEDWGPQNRFLRVTSTPMVLRNDASLRPETTLLVVWTPERPYNDEEAGFVLDYVRSGARLLIVDNYQHAYTLTAHLGVTFERVRLVDPATSVYMVTNPAGAFQVNFTNPSALNLEGATDARIDAVSTPNSFLDRDADGAIGASDPRGSFPVAAKLALGTGFVYAVASPMAFAAGDTQQGEWRRAVVDELLPEGGVVILDASRQPHTPPILEAAGAAAAITVTPPWDRVLIAAALILLTAVALVRGVPALAKHVAQPRATSSTLLAPTTTNAVSWTQRGRYFAFGAPALAALGLILRVPEAVALSVALLLACAMALLPGRQRVVAEAANLHPLREAATQRREVRLQTTRRKLSIEIHENLDPTFEVVEGSNHANLVLRKREPITHRYDWRPLACGPRWVGPLRARRTDPLGLRAQDLTIQPFERLAVPPRIEDARGLPLATRVPRISMGRHRVSRAGDGSEFHSLRDYQQGDPLRIVNWKASARSKGLMVNQRVHESMSPIAVVLDAASRMDVGPLAATPIVLGKRVAFNLIRDAIQSRDRVRFYTFGTAVHYTEPREPRQQLDQIERHLSSLAARGAQQLADWWQEASPLLSNGSLLVLVTSLDGDPTVEETLRRAQEREIRVLVVRPVPREDAPAAQADHPGVMRLRAMGVRVVNAPEDENLRHVFRMEAT